MEECAMSKTLGRPRKGKDRRQQIGVYVTGSVIEVIEGYVANRQATQRAYSRSDFFNEALELYMKEIGLIQPKEEGTNDDEQKRE
jgi:hypothetical protein